MNFRGRITILVLLLGVLLIGCTSQTLEATLDVEHLETEDALLELSEEEPEIAEPDPAAYEETDGRFSIEVLPEAAPAVTALYEAFFDGEQPSFVDSDGDLVVAAKTDQNERQPKVESVFLPGYAMQSKVDSTEIQDFIHFATSLAGQQILVDEGQLPSTIQLTDQAGQEIILEQPVYRVISSYGPSTAFIYSVGAADRLVSASYLGARDQSGAAFMKKIDPRFEEIIGDDNFSQDIFNIEAAAILDPDIVATSARTGWLDVLEQIELQAVLFDAETPESLKEAIQLTGSVFGPQTTAQANAWISYYEQTLMMIESATSQIPEEDRPRVLFTGTDPLRVASGEMYQTNIIEFAGGVSVSDELTGYWNDVNMEQIVIWNPDVIIVPPYGGASVEAIIESEEWQILDAVKAGRVYRMPKLVVPWDTPAPDSILGIVWLAERLHPDILSLSCAEEADYFYNTYYHFAITAEEIGSICKFD